MLPLLISHTMYTNSHKYLIYHLTSHMIQYSSGYDLRFPRKRSWFESQLGNNISFLLLLFSVCGCCFYFDIFFFFFIFNRIDNPPTSAFRYKITKGSRYLVYRNSVFSCVHTHHACITAIFDPTNEDLCSKTCLKGINPFFVYNSDVPKS